MPRDRFITSPFPQVRVNELERRELLHIVDTHVQDYITKYMDHVLVDKRKIDDRRWEHVKSKDKLRVYAERTHKELSRRGIEPETSLSATQRVQDHSVSKDLPVVMGIGTLVGDLDDLMYGVVSPTLDDMRVKASYIHDVDSAAVLCPVIGPSKEDPFRSIVIKWMAIDVPLSTNLVRSRDFVYIEATGTAFLPTGDRVGYHLMHSIDFPQTKPLPKKTRGNLSVFSCFRKKRGFIIENFAWGIVDPGGEIMRSLAVSVAAGALLSATNYVHCGQMKKLTWMLQHHSLEGQRAAQKKQCVVCDKRTSSAIGSIGKSTCRICDGCVCHSCKIRHHINFIAPGGQLVKRKIVVCAKCMKEATHWNAQEAAKDEASRREVTSSYSFMDTSESSSYDDNRLVNPTKLEEA
ncbi:hypothetical protein F444_17005 [Phytophthora nicotianae P1976]|uniref:FYVE-type domain-containing protein n=1 Tax=Phytophthora nicotianae P1976 TaxID=1317066 RepID=A0A080ZGG8_PHYNI|nr:hypothetical protein F444_17005 [Phytophthora nicotianae P1976]